MKLPKFLQNLRQDTNANKPLEGDNCKIEYGPNGARINFVNEETKENSSGEYYEGFFDVSILGGDSINVADGPVDVNNEEFEFWEDDVTVTEEGLNYIYIEVSYTPRQNEQQTRGTINDPVLKVCAESNWPGLSDDYARRIIATCTGTSDGETIIVSNLLQQHHGVLPLILYADLQDKLNELEEAGERKAAEDYCNSQGGCDSGDKCQSGKLIETESDDYDKVKRAHDAYSDTEDTSASRNKICTDTFSADSGTTSCGSYDALAPTIDTVTKKYKQKKYICCCLIDEDARDAEAEALADTYCEGQTGCSSGYTCKNVKVIVIEGSLSEVQTEYDNYVNNGVESICQDAKYTDGACGVYENQAPTTLDGTNYKGKVNACCCGESTSEAETYCEDRVSNCDSGYLCFSDQPPILIQDKELAVVQAKYDDFVNNGIATYCQESGYPQGECGVYERQAPTSDGSGGYYAMLDACCCKPLDIVDGTYGTMKVSFPSTWKNWHDDYPYLCNTATGETYTVSLTSYDGNYTYSGSTVINGVTCYARIYYGSGRHHAAASMSNGYVAGSSTGAIVVNNVSPGVGGGDEPVAGGTYSRNTPQCGSGDTVTCGITYNFQP